MEHNICHAGSCLLKSPIKIRSHLKINHCGAIYQLIFTKIVQDMGEIPAFLAKCFWCKVPVLCYRRIKGILRMKIRFWVVL